MENKKTAALLTLAAITATGASYLTSDVTNKDTPSGRLETAYGVESEKYEEATLDTQAAIDATISLYKRREAGDEPTEKQWKDAEVAVDELRAIADNEELRAIDRALETADAGIIRPQIPQTATTTNEI